MSEALNGTVYWQEVREGLFVHNESWDKVIERLPDLISAEKVLSKLQSPTQILSSGLTGLGTVGNEIITVRPDPEKLIQYGVLFDGGYYNVENLFLQWVYNFVIVEGVSNHLHNVLLPHWNPSFVTLVEEHMHVMTYVAALIYLYEQNKFKALVVNDNFLYTESHVRDAVKELTSTLYSKGAEYGESYRRHGIQGTLPRLWDKIARYAQLSALGRTATYEPKLDSAKDLLGYCIIAWSLIHELDEEIVEEVSAEATIQ
jgi:hypothetical protein